jgi:type I restriction-modification system DNA methylase subunit
MPRRSHQPLVALLQEIGPHKRRGVVFREFVEASAIAIRNSVDSDKWDEREQRYLQITSSYSKADVINFQRCFHYVVDLLDTTVADHLGHVFMTMELGSDCTGQYFSPDCIATLLAQINTNAQLNAEDLSVRLSTHPYVTLHDPCIGSGSMVLAFAETMRDHGFNYQQQLHVTAYDVDATACHMAYVQLSLLHIPAVIVHGNTLTLHCIDQWTTPSHVLNRWESLLQRRHPEIVSLERTNHV